MILDINIFNHFSKVSWTFFLLFGSLFKMSWKHESCFQIPQVGKMNEIILFKIDEISPVKHHQIEQILQFFMFSKPLKNFVFLWILIYDFLRFWTEIFSIILPTYHEPFFYYLDLHSKHLENITIVTKYFGENESIISHQNW